MPPSTIVLDNIIVVLRRSPATVVHQDRHHAVVLTELSLEALLNREFVGHHRAERVQIAEVSIIRNEILGPKSDTSSACAPKYTINSEKHEIKSIPF